jgi:YHS domain-containing protein
MFAFLWRALLLITALWFVQRLFASVFGPIRKTHNEGNREPKSQKTNKMVKDPICGMYLDPRLALPVESRQETHYFCSQECKNKYLANPF